MSDHQAVVSSYADLERDDFLLASEPDAVARELDRLGDDPDFEVVVCEEWLVDEKGIETLPTHYRVAIGRIERETEKAILLAQDGDETWIPKSCSRAFAKQPGVDIETPQGSLHDFAGGKRA